MFSMHHFGPFIYVSLHFPRFLEQKQLQMFQKSAIRAMQYITFGAKNQMRYFLYENALLLQGFRLTSNHKKLTKFSHYMPENHVNQYVVHHI